MLEEIEELREFLHQLISNGASREIILKTSQELDSLIVNYYKQSKEYEQEYPRWLGEICF